MFARRVFSTAGRLDRRLLDGRARELYSRLRPQVNGLSVDIAGTCNLRCTTCSLHDAYPAGVNAVIPAAVLEQVYRVAPRLRSISLMNNCEPLMNRDVARIVAALKLRNRAAHVSLVTNGMLLTRRLSTALVEAGVDAIDVSIDGATEATNDRVRVGARLRTIVEHVRDLTAVKAERRSRTPRVGVLAVSSTDNVGELGAIVDLAAEIGAETLTVNGLEPYSPEMDRKKLWGVESDIRYERVFDEVRARAARRGLRLSLPLLKLKPFRVCNLVDSVVDANGDVYPCPVLSCQRRVHRDGRSVLLPRVSFGSLATQSFDEVWQSGAYRNFRRALLRGQFPAHCQGCLLRAGVTCAVRP